MFNCFSFMWGKKHGSYFNLVHYVPLRCVASMTSELCVLWSRQWLNNLTGRSLKRLLFLRCDTVQFLLFCCVWALFCIPYGNLSIINWIQMFVVPCQLITQQINILALLAGSSSSSSSSSVYPTIIYQAEGWWSDGVPVATMNQTKTAPCDTWSDWGH